MKKKILKGQTHFQRNFTFSPLFPNGKRHNNVIHLSRFESFSPKNAFSKDWMELDMWFWRYNITKIYQRTIVLIFIISDNIFI